MRELPIQFQTDMARAVIALTKTESRRTRNLKEINKDPDAWKYKGFLTYSGRPEALFIKKAERGTLAIPCPYGQPGDVLWVRETFNRDYPTKQFYFKASWETLPEWLKEAANEHGFGALEWKPSIHMPKAAARIWLHVEEIKVERLMQITSEDAVKEGAVGFTERTYPDLIATDMPTPKQEFIRLWQHINGDGSFTQNPWVWVVKFKVLSTTGKPRTLGYQPDTNEFHFANKIVKL